MKIKVIMLIFFTCLTLFGEEYFNGWKISAKKLVISVAVDKDENVFLLDKNSQSIYKYNNKGRYKRTFGVRRKKKKEMLAHGDNLPIDLFVYGEELYLLDSSSGVVVFDLDGNFKRRIELKKGQLLENIEFPQAIHVDDKYIYIADTNNNRVTILDKKGNPVKTFGYKGRNDDSLILPAGISVAGDKIIVCDKGNNRIAAFDNGGIFDFNFGIEVRGTNDPGSFVDPEDIFTDSDGLVYVVDAGNGRIQVFDAGFELFRIFGERGYKDAQFGTLKDIWVTDEYIYVADLTGKCIKVFNKSDISFVRTIGKLNLFDGITGFLVMAIAGFIIFIIILKRIKLKEEKKKKQEKKSKPAVKKDNPPDQSEGKEKEENGK